MNPAYKILLKNTFIIKGEIVKKISFLVGFGVIILLLSSAGYAINYTTTRVNTTGKANDLINAVKHGNYTKVYRLLRRGANVNAQDEMGWTALMHAVSYANGRKLVSVPRYIQLAQLLINRGANIHIVGGRVNAFTLSAKYANSTMLRLLARKGANVNICAPAVNYSAVQWAAYKGHVYTLQTLISLGAKVTGKGTCGNNALHLAVKFHNRTRIFYYLLKVRNGININEKNREGNTALIIAAKAGMFRNIAYLLRNGANVNLQNNKNETALMYACYSTNRDYWKKMRVVRLLLKKYPKINLKDNHGKSAIFYASNLTIVKLLLHRDNGASVTLRDNRGRTVLINAVRMGLTGIVRYLIQFGANVNAKDYQTYTALDYALKMPSNLRSPALINLIKKAGGKTGAQIGS